MAKKENWVGERRDAVDSYMGCVSRQMPCSLHGCNWNTAVVFGVDRTASGDVNVTHDARCV